MRRTTQLRIFTALLLAALLTGCGPLEQRLADGTAVASGQQVGTALSIDTDGLLFRTEIVNDGTGGGQDEALSDTDALATQIQATLNALVTNTPPATNTVVPSPNIPTATIAHTATLSSDEIKLTSLAETLSAIGTGTATPSVTPSPSITTTSSGPTNTPSPTEVACLAMRFLADVTYPPNSTVPASSSFYKSWQVQNVGTCTWTGNFALVWYDGFQLNGTTPLKLGSGVVVRPGGYVTLTVQLWTPPQSGTYTSLWMLSDESGNLFGGGAAQNEPLLVRVVVPGQSPPEFTAPASTPPPFYTNTPGGN